MTSQAYKAAFEKINSGAPLHTFLNSIGGDNQGFFNACEALIDCVISLRNSGVKLEIGNKDPDDFMAESRSAMVTILCSALNARNYTKSNVLVSGLVQALAVHGKGRTFTLEAPAPAPPAPLRMEIVSMPTREKTSAIKYDSDGNIKSSTQTESDIALT